MPFFAAIRQDEYPATDETQCIAVHIPAGDEYKALLAGFIAFLTDVNSYEDPESAQADGIAATFDEGYSLTNWDGCGVPPECEQMNSNIILYSDRASVTSGNVPAWTSQTGSSLGGVWLPTPAATGDSMRWDFYLGAGRYNIDMIYQRATNNGKGDLKIYDPSLSLITTIAVDMRGSAQFNTVSGGSFDLPVSGRIRVEWVGTGASSGSVYNRPLQRIVIDRYADL